MEGMDMATDTYPTSEGPQTAEQIVDFLTYRNYSYNRAIAPHVDPARWRTVFGTLADLLEARYRTEGPAYCAHCRRGLAPIPAALMLDPGAAAAFLAKGRLCQSRYDEQEAARGMEDEG